MSFLSLVGVEFKKIKRSKIFLILFAATVILWIPSILNADMNFNMQAEGISPENNFFIQGFMGMAWFMFPASMVVGTVLLSQTERTNKGILKMLALPISTVKLCLAKFVVLLALAASQILMMVGMYYISAAIVTGLQFYFVPAICFQRGWLYSCFDHTNAGVFLVACGMYSNPDFFHRHWFSFHCSVSPDD